MPAAGVDRDRIVAGLFAWKLATPEDRREFAQDDAYVRELAAEAGPYLGQVGLDGARYLLDHEVGPGHALWSWRQLCEARASELFPDGAQVAPAAGRGDGEAAVGRVYEDTVAALFAWQLDAAEDQQAFAEDDAYVRELAAEAGPFLGQCRLDAARRQLAHRVGPGHASWSWRQLCEARVSELFHDATRAAPAAARAGDGEDLWSAALADLTGDSAGRGHAVGSEPPVRHAADEDADEDVWC